MSVKVIIVIAFLIALVADLLITLIIKHKKNNKEKYIDEEYYYDEINDKEFDKNEDIYEYEEDDSISNILNNLIPKKKQQFKDLKIDIEEEKYEDPIEYDWLDEDLRDIDNLIDLTCDDVLKAAKIAKTTALSADMKEIIEKINSTIMSNISSSYKNSIEYKVWDPSSRGLNLMQDIVMPLAKFYENKGFDVNVTSVNNPKNPCSREYAMIKISWKENNNKNNE